MASSLPSKDFQAGGVDDVGRPTPTDQNVLQKHVAFFDRNHDGLVYPWETFEGFRAIGAGYFLSMIGAFFINVALSRKTRPGKYPSLLFPIEVKNIHLAKHGSDSGVYDSQGRFVSLKFEEIFSKFARTHSSALTSDELMAMLKANREPQDYKGWLTSWTEWMTLYNLCKDNRGLLRKETIKAVYDGSLFEHMERERASAKKKAN
ncbi:probable peroxygenase 4 isoform X2 [Durio zibethinus]|uniref:Probable peroxygenase 4 isoform X2 n=1 Tax=Durio zibethinus TaxID=66656 RepID=A0A6P6BEY9_DURZI|nr:probable peroxygenase 4 isoform X2 [Durio zibethinus]